MFDPISNLSGLYVEYTRLLRQLHALIRRGEDETEDGDGLRDAMDEPWSRLTEAELVRVRNLGADLNSIDPANGRAGEEIPFELFDHLFREAQINRDWSKALALLRAHPEFFEPSRLLFLKGIFWARLGDFESALVFLEEAVRLVPTDPAPALALIQALAVLGRLDEAMDLIIDISSKREGIIPDDLVREAKEDRADKEALNELKALSEKLSHGEVLTFTERKKLGETSARLGMSTRHSSLIRQAVTTFLKTEIIPAA